LPPDTAVVSQIRDPVDRVLSAYEFAIEVAARQAFRSKKYVKPRTKTTTDDVWPWSYLIPFFVTQIKENWEKIKAQPLDPQGYWVEYTSKDDLPYFYNKVLNISKWELDEADKERLLGPVDPYNHPAYMPLSEFIQHPIADELLNNGELLQVLGATNYSHWEGHDGLQECIRTDPAVARELLDSAKDRIRSFTHMGTTDQLYPSFESAAASLGLPLDGPAYGGGENSAANVEAESKPLTWKEAMARGAAPRPSAQGELYGDEPNDGEDIHQLAADVRAARAKVEEARKAWNKAVAAGEPQSQLRQMRAAMFRAKAEAAAAQDILVSAREDMLKEKKKAKEELIKPKLLEMSLGVEVQRCAARAQKKSSTKRKASLAALTLPDGRPLVFGKESRKKIPEEVIQEIRRKNALDIELHKLASELLQQQRSKHDAAGKLLKLPQVTARELEEKPRVKKERGADNLSV